MSEKRRSAPPQRTPQKAQHKPVRKKKKFNPIKTFFKIVFSIVLIFLILAGGAAFAYYKVTGEMPFAPKEDVVTNASDMNLLDAIVGRNIKLNVAVFGVDADGTRTDVIFVVHYDSAKESLSLVSMPRDTRVSPCAKVQANWDSAGRSYPSVMKLNAVHSYSPKDTACENTVLQLEDMLGISIDHYVKIDFEAFRAIVDAVGGVEVDVPQDMYWDMSDTGDIKIDLKKGLQHLDGEQAEQLVRFRRYAEGDVGRIQVQQLFLKALAEKVLSTESILKNLPEYIEVMYKYVETDLRLTDALKYANYITKLDMNKISMETLPGVGQYVGNVSYFIHDAAETTEMVDRVFYNVEPITYTDDTTQNTAAAKDSKSLTIEIANGGIINGLAGQYTQKLAAEGYQMASATTYTGEQVNYTRIQVKESGIGSDLVQYFSNAKIEVAPAELKNADIRIILGLDEK